MEAKFKLLAPPQELGFDEVTVFSWHCKVGHRNDGTISTVVKDVRYRGMLATRAMDRALQLARPSLDAGHMAMIIGDWNTNAKQQQVLVAEVMRKHAHLGLQAEASVFTGRDATPNGRDHAVIWYARAGVELSRDDSPDGNAVKMVFNSTEHVLISVQAKCLAPPQGADLSVHVARLCEQVQEEQKQQQDEARREQRVKEREDAEDAILRAEHERHRQRLQLFARQQQQQEHPEMWETLEQQHRGWQELSWEQQREQQQQEQQQELMEEEASQVGHSHYHAPASTRGLEEYEVEPVLAKRLMPEVKRLARHLGNDGDAAVAFPLVFVWLCMSTSSSVADV